MVTKSDKECWKFWTIWSAAVEDDELRKDVVEKTMEDTSIDLYYIDFFIIVKEHVNRVWVQMYLIYVSLLIQIWRFLFTNRKESKEILGTIFNKRKDVLRVASRERIL